MASKRDFEKAVKACYSTWSRTYYQDYYGDKAAYPPVHLHLIRGLLLKAGAKKVLDAGCGPASLLRNLAADNFDLYGFDLTPEMVAEARRVMEGLGSPKDHIWEGSVLSPQSFRPPGAGKAAAFDAALCVGVLPHIPAAADREVILNLRQAVRPGGLVILEARNQLFALFTLNRYSYEFFMEELMRVEDWRQKLGPDAARLEGVWPRLKERFRLDLPPVRQGKSGEPGYDEVISRTHNPLVLKEQFQEAGFAEVELLFYHYHCLPPMFEGEAPELFRRESLAQENPTDWRGYFMASAFLLAGRRR